MTQTEIREKLINIFLFELDVLIDDIDDRSTANDLGMDSVDKALIISGIEREFDIEICDTEFDNLKEYLDYVKLIEKKLA